ncbi:MAG TPA: hypothetical protein VGW10_07285, partial [Solirubrobacteraceae bacterium]|nr:hypothetical protein [Solirubrobacteraceae bacterium]
PSVRRVRVLRDIPGTTVRAIACVRARRRGCANRRSAVLVPDPGAAAAAARTPRARAIDLVRHFCGPTRCYPVVGGAYVHKDLDHMNAVFAMSLGPFVLRALRAG